MDIYLELKKILELNGMEKSKIESLNRLSNFDNEVFQILKGNMKNEKGIRFDDRFRDIISDPNNLFIKRIEESGKKINNLIVLHNGIKVYDNCYYDKFTDILVLNGGVHEPAEERAFSYVIDKLKKQDKKLTMIELGSYWAFYSIWFKKEIQNSDVFCIEPDEIRMRAGIMNSELNNIKCDFTKGYIDNSSDGLNMSNFIKQRNIEFVDILHSDIQGYEFILLEQLEEELKNKKINYLFISTHSNKIHYDIISFLEKLNYRIVCQCDFDNQTYQYDGFILSCPSDNLELPKFDIGNRSEGILVSQYFFQEIRKKLKNSS
jgi:hypothetical protein